MKRIIVGITVCLALLIGVLTLQTYSQTGPCPDPTCRLVAPQIYAIPNPAKGQAAFDQCVQGGGDTVFCEPIRLRAISDDMEARFSAFFSEVFYQNIGYTQAQMTQAMLSRQLYFVDPAADNELPTVPTSLVANPIAATTLTLNWSPSADNVGVTGYVIDRCVGMGCSNFATAGNVGGASFSDSGLTASTVYGYRVRAKDAAGNQSAYSLPLEVTTAAAPAPPSNLITHWKFDEGSGTSAADSVGSNSLTLTNGPTWSPGISGNAVRMDGINDFANLTSNLVLSGPFSLVFWYQTSNNGQIGIILGEANGTGGGGAKIGIVQGSMFVRLVSVSDQRNLPAVNAWHLVAITRDASNKVDLYLDNAPAVRLFSNIAQAGTFTLKRIAANGSDASQPFNGLLDDIRVYNAALAAGDIAGLYASPGSSGGSSGGTPPPPPPPPPPPSGTIALNPSVTFQTMTGWETNVSATVKDFPVSSPAWPALMDAYVNDVGVTRVRLSLYAGIESNRDTGAEYLAGSLAESTWGAKNTNASSSMYTTINDNSDPFTLNAAGFKWTLLDWQMDNIVTKLRQRVIARGEPFYLMVEYTDWGLSTFEHWQNPDEYGEFMLAVFQHLQSKYGFVPNAIDVINEPDLSSDWTGSRIGNVIAKAGARLDAAGFHPDFTTPSTTSAAATIPFFDSAAAVPNALQYLREISYHRYGGATLSNIQAIAAKALQHGIRAVMDEWWSPSNIYTTLHEDLKDGRNSSWEQAQMAQPNDYFVIDGSGNVTITAKTKMMRQYYKYVRPGAVRIDAQSGNSSLDPIAWINSNGKFTVVVKASASGTFSVSGLPAGTYGCFYTTSSAYNVQTPDVTITVGQTISKSIPDVGVLTIYGK